RLAQALLSHRHAELPHGGAGRLSHGGDFIRGRIQYDMAVAHAAHQDAAGWSRRRVCLVATGDCQRLYAGVLPDDRAIVARHAGTFAAASNSVSVAGGVTVISDGAQPISIPLQRCATTFARGTRALEPLDLRIGAGETVVLLGPS